MNPATIDPSRRRRRLVAEGRALVSYVLGSRAPGSVVRRYVRAVLAEADQQPIELSRIFLFWPALLRMIEPPSTAELRLSRRLGIASRVAEMTPQGALRFHNYRERAAWLAWADLAGLLAAEAALFPVRWLLRKVARLR